MNFLLATLLAILSFNIAAQDNVPQLRRALIIGISEYGYPGISALRGVSKDVDSATRIALEMGIPKGGIHYIKDQDASKSAILKAIKSLSSQAADSRVFIYYSGHGTRSYDPGSKSCVEGLITYEGQTISNTELASALGSLSQTSDKVIVMLDACHSFGVLNEKGFNRSITSAQSRLTPKYALKAGLDNEACSKPANYRTRGLFDETNRLGGIKENFVQISAAKENEVSFDDPQGGGLATQGIRDCMLGKAKDADSSGAVSLEEIRECAQSFIDQRVANSANALPHHITVKGNRNLIPVPVRKEDKKPDTTPATTNQDTLTSPPPPPPPQSSPIHEGQHSDIVAVVSQPAPGESNTPVTVSSPSSSPPSSLPPGNPVSRFQASLATLKDIEAQRNPKRILDVKPSRMSLSIGKDVLGLKIKSSHDGYLYLVLLGSDAKSFYLLFPNGLDNDNRVIAGKALTFPRPDWTIKAMGPEGTDHLLVLIADSPRRLDGLSMTDPTADAPFTYALNDLNGRSALIDFLTGSGVAGKSESFGAKLFSIKEVK